MTTKNKAKRAARDIRTPCSRRATAPRAAAHAYLKKPTDGRSTCEHVGATTRYRAVTGDDAGGDDLYPGIHGGGPFRLNVFGLEAHFLRDHAAVEGEREVARGHPHARAHEQLLQRGVRHREFAGLGVVGVSHRGRTGVRVFDLEDFAETVFGPGRIVER